MTMKTLVLAILTLGTLAYGASQLVPNATPDQIGAWCIDNGYTPAATAVDKQGRVWFDPVMTGHAVPRPDMLSSPAKAKATMDAYRAEMRKKPAALATVTNR